MGRYVSLRVVRDGRQLLSLAPQLISQCVCRGQRQVTAFKGFYGGGDMFVLLSVL